MPLRSSGSRYWPAPGWSSGIFSSWGGAGLPGARGSVGVHSTNFSPISDCGRIRQEASVRKSWNAGSLDPHHDDRLARIRRLPSSVHRLVGGGDVDRGDRADLGTGDAHLLAGDQEARVVEHRADLVGAVVAAGAGAEDQYRDGDGERGGDGEQASHGPGGTSVGRQSPSRLPSSRNGWSVGFGQPAFGWVDEPGQRGCGPKPSELKASNWALSGIGSSVSVAAL